jgi:GPH family glycoside/pentoside/hexuronide:cation symporter
MMPAKMGVLSFTLGTWHLNIPKHVIWFGVTLFLMDIGTTVFMVPYYALGIELSPTYSGRMRVAAWRSLLGGIAGMISPWYYLFCQIAIFGGVLYGARYLTGILAIVATVAGIYAAVVCKERTHMEQLERRKRESFFSAVRGCARSWHFWRITIIYVIMLFIGPLFEIFGGYVTLWYVFQGDKKAMGIIGGYTGMIGTAMGMIGILIFTRISNRFGKHNALRTAIVLFIIGHLLKLVLYNPACPQLLYLTPFFFSIGIAATFTILSALQADIVDVDELASGQRREGMFGAVASVTMKSSGALATALAGFLVAMTKYDVTLGVNQPPGTFTAMRLLFSLGPIPFLLAVLALLYKYPFTAQRMEEIHQVLKRRHAAAASAQAL